MKISRSSIDAGSWNQQIADLPGAHILQTWEWGQVKSRLGWQSFPQAWRDENDQLVAAALILQRTVSLGGFADRLRVLYAPKGPLLDWDNPPLRRKVLQDLAAFSRQRGAIFVKIDPDVYLASGVPGQPGAQENPTAQAVVEDLRAAGWRFSGEQIQFRNTVLLDLTPDTDTLLANMKQKTRYNVRLSERKGVTIRPGSLDDLDWLYRMYAQTSVRDGFVIRDHAYYTAVWSTFLQAGMVDLLVAEVSGEPVAAVFCYRFAGKAWYLYGMSSEAHREKMPNYLLQWHAIQRARQAGCRVYDLWGAPDVFDAEDPLAGVYRFKEGLGGQVMIGLGAWDLPTRPVAYRLYAQVLPRLLELMRRRGKARTRQVAGA